MERIVKVSAYDCLICKELSYHDVSIAEDEQMEFETIELGDLAESVGSPIYNYVVNYHLEGDGSIVVPIYLVMDGGLVQASGAVKEAEELKNLVHAWKSWKSSQPEN